MNDKQQILQMAEETFQRWENFLSGLTEMQITSRMLADDWSIKDVVAHLMAWQQVSLARLEAGLQNREPAFPKWPNRLNPETEEPLEEINGWIYQTHRERPWSGVYADWRQGFLRLLELGRAIPEEALLAVGRYAWLGELPLAAVLTNSCKHHQEHLEILQGRFR